MDMDLVERIHPRMDDEAWNILVERLGRQSAWEWEMSCCGEKIDATKALEIVEWELKQGEKES